MFVDGLCVVLFIFEVSLHQKDGKNDLEMTAEEYALDLLESEIKIINNSDRKNVFPELSVFEKAIILKYSENGYEDLNEKLRTSQENNISPFGFLLADCLKKLPNFVGNVYRSVTLTKKELKDYENAFVNNQILIKHFFISTSRSASFANQFGTTRFEIFTKSGKDIEKLSKYTDEKEVIILYNCHFRLVNFSENFIQMIEI